MGDLPMEDWEITAEDEAYFNRLSSSVAEEKVAEYLATHPKPLKEANQLLAEFQQDVKTEATYTYDGVMAGYQALAEGLPSLLAELDTDESLPGEARI